MKLTSVICLLAIFIIFAGCSNDTNSIGVENQVSISDSFEYHSTPIISHSVGGVTTYQAVFGIWEVAVDTSSMTADIVPPRNASAIGNIFDADLSQFLEVSPCANCLTVDNIYLDSYGNLNIAFRMKHPFDNITARPDLHGFDVRGIFIGQTLFPQQTFPDIKVTRPDGTEEDAQTVSFFVLNADGYTSHFDELPTDPRYFVGGQDLTGNLNPFLRFFEDYSTTQFDPNNPIGQNVMKVGGSSYARTAVFNMSEPYVGQFKFYFVADVSYGQSAVFANRKNPQYYLPAFHRTEPWRVEYWMENNNLTPVDPTSTGDLVVQVFDWQHNATVDPNYPDPSNLGGIPESSKVAQLELSIPGFQDAPIIVDTPEAGTGTPQDPLRYRFTITNSKQSAQNQYGLLVVRDELNGLASPHGRMPIPESPVGFPYETSDIRDYSLYQVVYVNSSVIYGNPEFMSVFGPNELFVPQEDQVAGETQDGSETIISPEFYMDSGHKFFQYRWDYDYDGVTFNLDGSGLPSPEIIFPSPGEKKVGLRVRTNSVPPREFIYTIPVYAEGEIDADKIQSSHIDDDSTSDRQNHSIAASSKYFYMVYMHEDNNQRDIWLAIWDRNGILNKVQITDTPESDISPVIAVREIGTSPGVYIAYSTNVAAERYIYATHGNLDGSGFEPSNVKRITDDVNVFEMDPVIFFHMNKLRVIYTRKSVINSYRIFGATSIDYGDTWGEDGWLVDNSSDFQGSPTAISWGNMGMATLVWVDYINSATRGADLYQATGGDIGTWGDITNISSTNDLTNDTAPSIAYSMGTLAIAYLSNPQGSSDNFVHVKFIDSSHYYDDNIFDYKVRTKSSSSYNHSYPSIDSKNSGSFIVSYGAYAKSINTANLEVLELQPEDSMCSIKEIIRHDLPSGIVTATGQNLMPNVVCYSPFRHAVEAFVTYKDYTYGSEESLINPSWFFGKIESKYFIYYAENIDF